MKCPNCKNTVNDNVSFCTHCGFDLRNYKSNNNISKNNIDFQPNTENRQKIMKNILILALWICIGILMFKAYNSYENIIKIKSDIETEKNTNISLEKDVKKLDLELKKEFNSDGSDSSVVNNKNLFKDTDGMQYFFKLVPSKHCSRPELELFFQNDPRTEIPELEILFSDKKYGYIDNNLKEKIPFKFYTCENFKNGVAIAGEKDESSSYNSKGGLIDKNGNYITKARYDYLYTTGDGYIGVNNVDRSHYYNNNNYYGIIDKTGKQVIPPSYGSTLLVSEGVIVISKRDYIWTQDNIDGVIDLKGNLIIPMEYNSIITCHDGYLRFRKHFDGKWGYMDKTGKVVIPEKFDMSGEFENGIATAEIGRKNFYIDKSGNEIEPKKLYETTESGVIPVELNGNYAIMNSIGDYISRPKKYKDKAEFENSTFEYLSNGKAGLVNGKGEIVIEAKYQNMKPFKEGLAAFKQDNKWGYIDANEKVIVKPKYSEVFEFNEGIAKVAENISDYVLYGYVNKYGKEIVKPTYDIATNYKNGCAIVGLEYESSKNNSKYMAFILDTKGVEHFKPFEYYLDANGFKNYDE